jgi:manganese transport protein
LNFRLAGGAIIPWVSDALWRAWFVIPITLGVVVLLAWVTFARPHPQATPARNPGAAVALDLPGLKYRSILVPLDHSDRDRAAVAHAVAMARLHGATIHLLHVEEGATSQLFGPLASTAEVSSGQQYLEDIVNSLKATGLEADLQIVHGRSPRSEIIRAARTLQPDLVVMGAHGHTGIKDLIFGTTIDGVRHAVSAAVLVVGEPPA